MMSNNSQDAYFVTSEDTITYHLGTVPSIQEIVLTKCNVITSQEMKIWDSIKRKGARATSEELYLKDQLIAKMTSGVECEVKVQDELISAAFKRELKDNPKQVDEILRSIFSQRSLPPGHRSGLRAAPAPAARGKDHRAGSVAPRPCRAA
jgi:hypothetical protein